MEDDNHAYVLADQEPGRNQPPPYPCQHCDQSFTTQSALSCHIKQFHPQVIIKPFHRHVCQKMFPYSSQVKLHEQQAHSKEGVFNCPKCSYRSKIERNLKRHLKIHEQNREKFRCNVCAMEYFTRLGLRIHLKMKHGSLVNKSNTVRDKSQTNGDEADKGNEEDSQAEASGGIVEVASENILTEVCEVFLNGLATADPPATGPQPGLETAGNAVSTAGWGCYFGNHAPIPADKEPQRSQPPSYPCQHCKQSFTTYQGLSRHIKWIHPTVIKESLQCQVCHKIFPQPSTLKQHIEDAHGDCRTYSCPKCTFHSKVKRNFKRHLKIHDKNRERFKCTKCASDYATNDGLKFHLKTKHVGLNNEGNGKSDTSQGNSKTDCNEEDRQGEGSGGIAGAAVGNISTAISHTFQNGLGTIDQPTMGHEPVSKTENALVTAGWGCYSGNINFSHHQSDGPIEIALTASGNASENFSQGVSLSFLSIQNELLTSSNPTPEPINTQCEASGGIMDPSPESISIAMSYGVLNELVTVDHHPSVGPDCTESRMQFPFGEWNCHCGNMYASQDDLQKHWDEDHRSND